MLVGACHRLIDLRQQVAKHPSLAAQHALHVRLEQVQGVENGLLAATAPTSKQQTAGDYGSYIDRQSKGQTDSDR
jgi:hypothetical protein